MGQVLVGELVVATPLNLELPSQPLSDPVDRMAMDHAIGRAKGSVAEVVCHPRRTVFN